MFWKEVKGKLLKCTAIKLGVGEKCKRLGENPWKI